MCIVEINSIIIFTLGFYLSIVIVLYIVSIIRPCPRISLLFPLFSSLICSGLPQFPSLQVSVSLFVSLFLVNPRAGFLSVVIMWRGSTKPLQAVFLLDV